MVKTSFMKDHYAILGVSATAEESLIHAAYSVKTRLYPPGSGDPGEAVARLADINEAYAVLSSPGRRKAYDTERAEHAAAANMELPGLPLMRAQELAYPVFVFKPRINLSKAQSLFLESSKTSATKFAQGSDLKPLVSSVCCVYVPSWFISGSASGQWRAAAVTVDAQEVDCARCGGKGTIAGEGYKPQCPQCHGSGKSDRGQPKKSAESGTAKASVNEYVPGTFAGIEFRPDFSAVTRPAKATAQMIGDLYCLQPEQDYEKAKELLSERLALALKNKALESLSQYDSVEGPHFGSTEAYVFSKVELRLYPVYVCPIGGSASRQFAVCDGITGKTHIPQQKSLKGRFGNVLTSLLILAALGSALYFGKGLLLDGDSPKPGVIAKVSTQVVQDTNLIKELLPARKQPSEQASPDHDAGQVAVAARNAVRKPAKKVSPAIQEHPSFDCSTASIKAEKLICASKELAEEDRKLAAAYEQRKQSASFEIFRNKVIVDQLNWTEHVRNACANETCLLNAYHKRMEALSEASQAKKPEVCPIPGHC
jgi:hypothetical protein